MADPRAIQFFELLASWMPAEGVRAMSAELQECNSVADGVMMITYDYANKIRAIAEANDIKPQSLVAFCMLRFLIDLDHHMKNDKGTSLTALCAMMALHLRGEAEAEAEAKDTEPH